MLASGRGLYPDYESHTVTLPNAFHCDNKTLSPLRRRLWANTNPSVGASVGLNECPADGSLTLGHCSEYFIQSSLSAFEAFSTFVATAFGPVSSPGLNLLRPILGQAELEADELVPPPSSAPR